MNDSIISFTKIGVVQLRVGDEIKSELSTDDFLARLETAIESDVSKHKVTYDNETGNYEIFHNGKKYKVYCGNKIIDKTCSEVDILQNLNNLVDLSNTQKKDQVYQGNEEETESRSLSDIVRDGDKGVFYTEDDKVKYIEYQEQKIRNDYIFSGLSDVLSGASLDSVDWDATGGFIVSMIVMFTFLIVTGITKNYWFLIGSAAGLGELFATFATEEDALISKGIKAVLRFFQCGYYVMKRYLKKQFKKLKLKKISNSIIESELSETISSKAPVKVARKTKSSDKTLKGEAKNLIEKIFYSYLPNIEDEELKKVYAQRLDEIIEMYKNIPEADYNKGYSHVLSQLSYLDGEIGEQRRKEISTHVMNTDFEKTRETVENISSSVKSSSR